MPIGGLSPDTGTPDDTAQAASQLPFDQSLRTSEAFGHNDFSQEAAHLVGDVFSPQGPKTTPLPGMAPWRPPLDTDTLNEKYGVPGVLRFNAPAYEGDAAFRQHMALEHQFRDTVFSRTNPQPLTDFGAGLAGGLLDPAALATMVATGGFSDAALGALGVRTAAEAAPAVTTLGRVANAARVPLEGALANVPFVGVNAGLTSLGGDEYDMGDALRDIAAGAILHTTAHVAFRAAPALFRRGGQAADPEAPADAGAIGGVEPQPRPAMEPNPAPAAGVPAEVDALPEGARRGAFIKAAEDLAADRPVDVGQYVDRELNPPTLTALDEASAEADFPVRDVGDLATAVTTRGTEIPVRYGLVELSDLVTSHNDDLTVNPSFPPELQPRDRERAGAQARNYQLEAELNPKLLMGDVSAAGGAPIVGPDGVVESGNGRTIALRRSAAKGGEAYARYRAELKAQGYDTGDMKQPVLVRRRTEPMTGAQRSALTREMNADVTERMSATEQAAADAKHVDDAMLSHIDGTAAGKRKFAQAFLARVAPDQINSLVAPDGALSKAGEERIDAALTAKAYGDPRLVEALYEAADPNIKTIGQALKSAAPFWAAMRSAAARGQIPPDADMTAALRSAVDLVRHARDNKLRLGELVEDLRGQGVDMFGSRAISAETEAFLHLFFRDEGLTRPLAAEKIGQILRDFAEKARELNPGPDLFGETPNVDTARNLIQALTRRFADGDAGDLDLLRPPGRTEGEGGDGAGGEARISLLDLQRQRGEGDGGGGGPPSKDGGQAEGQGGADPAAADRVDTPPKISAEALIAGDPELKALADDNARLAAEAGIPAPETPPNQDPATLAEAIRAAAVCLIGELG